MAFNTAVHAGTTSHYSPGFSIADIGANLGQGTYKRVTLQSALFANNTYSTPAVTADDYGVAHFASAGNGNTTPTSGGNNLVFATMAFVPVGTLRSVCPGLGPSRRPAASTCTCTSTRPGSARRRSRAGSRRCSAAASGRSPSASCSSGTVNLGADAAGRGGVPAQLRLPRQGLARTPSSRCSSRAAPARSG